MWFSSPQRFFLSGNTFTIYCGSFLQSLESLNPLILEINVMVDLSAMILGEDSNKAVMNTSYEGEPQNLGSMCM